MRALIGRMLLWFIAPVEAENARAYPPDEVNVARAAEVLRAFRRPYARAAEQGER